MFIKTKENEDYTDTVLSVYHIINNKYGYTARVSNIFQLLRDAFGLNEFDLLEITLCNNGPLISYLIDKQIDWQKGKKVDFSEITEALIKEGDFSNTEKLLFNTGKIDERLWAIFLAICNPSGNLK